MNICQIEGKRRFCLELDGEVLEMCPCCGLAFETEHAATKAKEKIEAGAPDWKTALTLQKMLVEQRASSPRQ